MMHAMAATRLEPFCMTILLLLSVANGVVFPAAATAQAPPPCESGAWAEPVVAFFDSAGLASPSLFFEAGEGYVVGNERWTTELKDSGLRIGRLGGAQIPIPHHPGMNYIMPVAGIDAAGKLILLWAEPPKHRGGPPRLGDQFGRIFRSAFLGGDIRINGQAVYWSMPEPLYQGEEIIWRGVRESTVSRAEDEAVHLAFSTLGNGAIYIRLNDGDSPSHQTRAITEFIGEQGLYTALALGPGKEVYLASIASHSEGRVQHNNSVFFRRSLDGGHSWEDRVLVSKSDGREANTVRAAVTSGDEIHLVWRRDILSGHGSVWHSVSTDRGSTWSAPRQITNPGPGNPAGLSVAADAAGALHVAVVFTGDMPHDQLYYMHWKDTSWSPPCSVDPKFPVAHMIPAIAADDRGRIHLLWNRGVPRAGSELASVAVRSSLEHVP